MIICAAGDIHGAMDRLYIDVAAFEASLGMRFDHVLDAGAIRVGGVGGCYGPSDYRRRSGRLQGYAKRHYTSDEIERLANVGGVDIVLTHDAPSGVRFERHRRGASYVSEAAGLDDLLARLQPRICFFGHHHTRIDAVVSGVRCIGLNRVAMPGNLVAINIEPGKPDFSLLGEYIAMRM